jgi:hypothetical protein
MNLQITVNLREPKLGIVPFLTHTQLNTPLCTKRYGNSVKRRNVVNKLLQTLFTVSEVRYGKAITLT